MFSNAEAQETHASKTFEPDEDLAAVQQQQQQQQPEAMDSEGAGAEAEAAKATSAPSQEQMVAIKAAIANAQTLEEIQRLEEALKTGALPSELKLDGGPGAGAGAGAGAAAAEENGGQEANGGAQQPDGMEVG